MSELPVITTASDDVVQFLTCMRKQQEEQRLFQFLNGLTRRRIETILILNGLNDTYQSHINHILFMTPLPSVEVVSGMLQQEKM